ncbi:2-dehydropantoate 2-reductase [Robertmurraya korlensis]|uniref:2-dehydropantoate 2-reductase n=1 Tax=Robertmurraya korlensis TaxID=519977 RepID=UPI0020410BF3|nr:2-dehydropantoate 2-reductase [Robertmurraya korlensis]MCM3600293.1 2-dehydropantoate 2-reductase [Robertmurraya korlensis]
MKIAIIGGGAVGLLFASFLQEENDVILYTRSEDQSERIRTNGLVRKNGEESVCIPINVQPISKWDTTGIELVILCVKEYMLNDLVKDLNFPANLPLLFVQNGMGHLSLLKKINTRSLFIGSVEHGALKVNNHTVSHTGIGVTKLAIFQTVEGDRWILDELILQSIKNFPVQFEQDYMVMLTKKLVVNAVINPLTAILGVTNGSLLTNNYYQMVFEQLFNEVCLALGIDRHTYYENLVRVCKNTAKNESSMLKDVKNDRRTEIDTILGYVLEEAQRKDIKVPLTLAFYHCIKGKEIKEEGM